MAGYGMQSHVLFQFQDSYGTALVNSLNAIPFVSESLELGIEQVEDNSLRARFYGNPTFSGARSITGDVQVESDPESIGYLITAFCGSDDVTDFTHTFNLNQEDFDPIVASRPFTAEVYRDVGSAFLYSDLVGNTLEIAGANGELVNFTLGVIGGGFSKQVAGTPVFPSGQAPFKWDQTSVSFDGAAEVDITDFTISGNKNLEAIFTNQASAAPRKIKRTGFEEVTISGTILFQSHSYFDAFDQQSTHQLVINYESNSPNALSFDFPQVKFTSFNVTADGPEVIEADFEANAEFSVDSNTAMTINLTNVRTISY